MPKVCPKCQVVSGGYATRCVCGFDLTPIPAPDLPAGPVAGPPRLADSYTGRGAARWLLTVGQVAAGVSVVVAAVQTMIVLTGGGSNRAIDWPAAAGGALQLLLAAALFVTFARAKAAADVAARQDDENRRLWEAVDELRAGRSQIGPDGDG